MSESPECRLKRLAMRSSRRGTREMDVILSRFAADRLASMDGAALDAYEALLSESDVDLLAWVTGASPPPGRHAAAVASLAAHARGRRG